MRVLKNNLLLLFSLLLASCEPDKETYPEPLPTSFEITIDGIKTDISSSSSLSSHISRFRGNYGLFIRASGLSHNSIWIDFNTAKFPSPGIYKTPTDSLGAFYYDASPNGNNGKSWYTTKRAPITLNITELIREVPTGKPNAPYTRISGSFAFTTDTLSKDNGTTGNKTITGTFKNLSLSIFKEYPNFEATLNQKKWEGDAYLEWIGLSFNFYLRAYNQWGDLISVDYPQKLTNTGNYTTSSASYKKRMPDGSFQQWILDKRTNAAAAISITQIDQAKKLMSGKVSFIGTPVKHTGALEPITINAVFTDVSF